MKTGGIMRHLCKQGDRQIGQPRRSGKKIGTAFHTALAQRLRADLADGLRRPRPVPARAAMRGLPPKVAKPWKG